VGVAVAVGPGVCPEVGVGVAGRDVAVGGAVGVAAGAQARARSVIADTTA